MLADEIGSVLSSQGGLTASELASVMGTGVEEVSFALFSSHGRFRRDSGSPPRWRAGSSSRQAGSSPRQATPTRTVAARPLRRRPSSSLGLYSWQVDALESWENNGGRGVIEAVTGTGKTMVGVAAALDELARRGQVVVLVPAIELQRQWLAHLQAHLPALRSGGQADARRLRQSGESGDGLAGGVARRRFYGGWHRRFPHEPRRLGGARQ